MNFLTKALMLSLALWATELSAQDTMIVRVSLRISDFRFDTLEGYDFIRSNDNRVVYASEKGKPMLPVFVPTYIIPFWKTVSYCEVISTQILHESKTLSRCELYGHPL